MSGTKYSYFDDFTPEERKAVFDRMSKEEMTFDEIMKRHGHPSTWETEQIRMNI